MRVKSYRNWFAVIDRVISRKKRDHSGNERLVKSFSSAGRLANFGRAGTFGFLRILEINGCTLSGFFRSYPSI